MTELKNMPPTDWSNRIGTLRRHTPENITLLKIDFHTETIQTKEHRIITTKGYKARCNLSCTQCTNVCQQICCVCQFLEGIQSFVRQYNMLLLSFVYFDPAFLID